MIFAGLKIKNTEEKVQDFTYFSTDNDRTQNTRNSIVSLKKLEQLSVKKSRNPCRRSWPKNGGLINIPTD